MMLHMLSRHLGSSPRSTQGMIINKQNPVTTTKKNIENNEQQRTGWTAVTFCTSVTVVSFLLVFWAATLGWPGTASNCYDEETITADCYCERLRGDEPGDVWFAQPMNTVSNVWFVLGGLLIAYSADSKQFPSSQWWKNQNMIADDKVLSTTYALASCLLGVGSTCLHASFTTWGRQVDMMAMYLIATFAIIYPLLRTMKISRQQAIWMYLGMNTVLAYWTVLVGSPEQTRRLFTTMIVSSMSYEWFKGDAEYKQQNRYSRKVLATTLSMFGIAVLVWKASESNGPLCDPDSLWQGHSLWHLLSATAIAGLYFYYLAEGMEMESKSITAEFLLEGTPPPHGTPSSGSDTDSSWSESEESDASSQS